MNLIKKLDGKYYWLVDNEVLGFAESVDFNSEVDAIRAAMFGGIEWVSIYPVASFT